MHMAAQVVLAREQSAKPESLARGRRIAARLVFRPKVVLLAVAGKQDLEIASALGVVPRTAARWRARFLKLYQFCRNIVYLDVFKNGNGPVLSR